MPSSNFQGHHPIKTVKVTFSELYLLNQWLDFYQTFIDTLFLDRQMLIRFL